MRCRTVKKLQKNLSLTLLVCNCAGSLASRLAGCLALAAAALLCAFLQICLVDGLNVLHYGFPPFPVRAYSFLYYTISFRQLQEKMRFFSDKTNKVSFWISLAETGSEECCPLQGWEDVNTAVSGFYG